MRQLALATTLALAASACYAAHRVDGDGGVRGDSSLPPPDASRRDAGPPDLGPPVGPVLTDCYEAAAVGRTNQACAFDDSCFGQDLCTSVSVTCVEGRLSLRDDRSDPRFLFPEATCSGRTFMANITGDTPAGPVSFVIAWASHSHAFAVDLLLLLGTEFDSVWCSPERLAIFLRPLDVPLRSYEGRHEVNLLITVGGLQPTLVPGIFEVTTYDVDTDVLSGELTVDYGEWQLAGPVFEVGPCDELDRSGP